MLCYQIIPVTAFQQNCSLIWCDETLEAAVIDPGGDLDVVLAEVKRRGLTLKQIWLTHGHIDHAGGTAELASALKLPIIGPHEGDEFWIDGLPEQSRMFGFTPCGAFKPTRWLEDGDTVSIGNCTLTCATARATLPATWCSTLPKSSAPSLAMFFLRVPSGAPIFRRVTTRL